MCLNALIIVIFFFFTGLDRAIVLGIASPLLATDWLYQLYVLGAMICFALGGIQLNRWFAFNAALNLILLPLNSTSAFVNRTNLCFWLGYAGQLSEKLMRKTVVAAVVLGSIVVVIDGLKITFVSFDRGYAAGFFLNPNYVCVLALGIPFLAQTKYPMSLSTLVAIACVFSGSHGSILICLVVLAFTFRLQMLRVVIPATLFTAAFALTFPPHLNYSGKTYDRATLAYELGMSQVQAVVGPQIAAMMGSSWKPPPRRPSQAVLRDMVVDARVESTQVATDLGLRMFLPLADIHADQVGHVGLILYLGVYGIPLGAAYAFCVYKVIPLRDFVVLAIGLLIFTDPILEIGIGILALRAAPSNFADRSDDSGRLQLAGGA